MALGERIRDFRQSAGLSQEEVAELVGVSRQAVTKWEGNQSAPSRKNLCRLAEIFGITVDRLLAPGPSGKVASGEQIVCPCRMGEEKKLANKGRQMKKYACAALACLILGAVLGSVLYIISEACLRTMTQEPAEGDMPPLFLISTARR